MLEGGTLTRTRLAVALLTMVAGVLAGMPAAASAGIPATLKASCELRDAADDNLANGNQLPYRRCDDGLPPPRPDGRTPNIGGVSAVTVPQKYGGYAGLPPKVAPDPTGGADPVTGEIALDVNVSLPPEGTPGPYPLVVMMHGCCSGNKTDWEAPTVDAGGEKWHYSNAWFASRGYVVLNYTSRGFIDPKTRQGSTGETQLDSRHYEINDYQHLAGQLADDAFFNVDPGRVVVTSGSYGGGLSWMALTDPTWQSPEAKPMRLAAVAPKYAWTDMVYSLVPNGAHRRDALPAFDGSSTKTPLGFPKRSILAGLYASGKSGATFPAYFDEGVACLQSSDPYESNPLCARTLSSTRDSLIADRSAYYQNDFFARIAADPAARVPVFSAGAFTDPLFTSVEHRRMAERLKAAVPGYPIQEYYGDYQHFVQNKAKEWNDVCGADRHVCRYADYPGGELDAAPAGRVLLGVTTRLNRLVDAYAKPAANASQAAPAFDVSASLQICPQNASAAFPADEPGPRFTEANFNALAPNTLRVIAPGRQSTTSNAEPNPHATRSDPVLNERTNNKACPVEQAPSGGASAGPGVATYDSAPLPIAYTMIGRTRATVAHTGAGSGVQLNARLYDLYPDGKQVMVDRVAFRAASPNQTSVIDLAGNGWRFPAGHRVRIELAQDDDPYIKVSTQPSSLTLTGVDLRIPVREASATLGGDAAPGFGQRVRLLRPLVASTTSRSPRFRVRVRARSPRSRQLSHYQLEARPHTSGRYRRLRSRLKSESVLMRGRYGVTYWLRARAVSRSGTVGPWAYATTVVPFDQFYRRAASRLRPRYQGIWARVLSRVAFGVNRPGLHRSLRRGARVTVRLRGSRIYIVGRRGPRGGRAAVYLDGRRRRTVTFFSRRTRARRVIASLAAPGRRVHTLRVVNLGRRARGSRGTRVEIDGFAARRP